MSSQEKLYDHLLALYTFLLLFFTLRRLVSQIFGLIHLAEMYNSRNSAQILSWFYCLTLQNPVHTENREIYRKT